MTEQYIWNYFKQRGLNDFGIAGLMGNLFAESGLNPRNLQQTYEKKLGFNDNSYTEAVDNGTYDKFITDNAGYGIAQWTYHSRKKNLYDFAKNSNKSIGDLNLQLDFLWYELTTMFDDIVITLQLAKSVLQASNKVLFDFERPYDQGIEIQKLRASYGQVYYDKFSSKEENMLVYSPLVTHVQISPNKTSPRSNDVIDTITIHCVVGQCTVESLGNLFAKPERQASSNYGIGYDGRIACFVSETDQAWTSGGSDENGNPIYVNGISGYMNDGRAITIEVASDTFEPYAVTDAAYNALIELLTDICSRNPSIGTLKWMNDKSLVGKVNLQNMTAHRWFGRTQCPGNYLFTHFGDIANKVNEKLNNRNKTNDVEDEDMTIETFEKLWQEMRTKLQDNDSSAYSEEARQWATSTGLIKGSSVDANGQPNGMWEDLLTREQFVTVLYRFAQMMGKI